MQLFFDIRGKMNSDDCNKKSLKRGIRTISWNWGLTRLEEIGSPKTPII
jgi:hypothetical protein